MAMELWENKEMHLGIKPLFVLHDNLKPCDLASFKTNLTLPNLTLPKKISI